MLQSRLKERSIRKAAVARVVLCGDLKNRFKDLSMNGFGDRPSDVYGRWFQEAS
jgi:hypothetical protein